VVLLEASDTAFQQLALLFCSAETRSRPPQKNGSPSTSRVELERGGEIISLEIPMTEDVEEDTASKTKSEVEKAVDPNNIKHTTTGT
jgi:hypothetical protein